MKKIVMVFGLLLVLSGCAANPNDKVEKSKSPQKIDKVESSKKKDPVKTPESSTPKKVELVGKTFEIDGDKYHIDVLKQWQDLALEDGVSFRVGNNDDSEGLMVFGLKKVNLENFSVFKDLVSSDFMSSDDITVKTEEIEKKPFQTTRYQGEAYIVPLVSEGVKVSSRYYFLETETDYVVVVSIALPSYFEKNSDTMTSMLESFEAS